MPRILFVSTSTTVGGAEKTLFRLACGLDKNRFSVAGIVSLKPSGHYQRLLSGLGYKTESLDLSGMPEASHLSRLCAIIEREKPDVVHALMYQAIQLCRLAKLKLGGKADFRLISSPRVGYRSRSFLTLLVDKTLKDLDDLLIAESNSTKEHLVEKLAYPASGVHVIYNGVEDPAGDSSRETLRAELNAGPREILIGAAGRLDKQKGFSFLIDAAGMLDQALPWKLVIFGEGPLRADLEKRIKTLGLESRIRLLGERADAAASLRALDIFVLPSLWEGLPNALLEAMAAGLPCLASSIDGVPEAVESGVNGRLVPCGHSAALAEALSSLIEDPAARRRLGQAAAQTARRRFSLPRMMAQYEAAYDEVLSRSMS